MEKIDVDSFNTVIKQATISQGLGIINLVNDLVHMHLINS